MGNLEQELSQLDLCPLLKCCIPEPSEEDLENYCAINYEECEKYIEYKMMGRKGVGEE